MLAVASFWGKLKVVLTMHHYIRQLLAIRDPSRTATPGPLSIPPSAWDGLIFDGGEDCPGIRLTTHALAEYFHKMHWKREHRTSKLRSPLKRGRLDDSLFSPPLVFTHNDLSMSNILLDNEGRL
jgi:thiamine kinase-like enzyme